VKSSSAVLKSFCHVAAQRQQLRRLTCLASGHKGAFAQSNTEWVSSKKMEFLRMNQPVLVFIAPKI
jgi:hypothetical protein